MESHEGWRHALKYLCRWAHNSDHTFLPAILADSMTELENVEVE